MKNKELKVKAIENGTVIDHIPSDKLFDVIRVLKLNTINTAITFSCNFDSLKLGKKAIIKIWDHYLKEKEVNKLALVAPNAKINIIKNYDVIEKLLINVPDSLENIAKCMNPNCITNYENIKTKFDVINSKPIVLRCHYCEKLTDQENLIIK